VTVLDKSRADWKDFKQGDETVEEELEMHKRSGDQVGPGRDDVGRGQRGPVDAKGSQGRGRSS
jgi:hypothetical protein